MTWKHAVKRYPTRDTGFLRRYRPVLEILEDRRVLAAPITFAAIGDFGVASSILNLGNGVLGAPDSEGNVANLVHSWDPQFVLTMGDNNYLCGEQNDAPLIPLLQLLVLNGDIMPSTAGTILDYTGFVFSGVVELKGTLMNNSAVVTGLSDTSQLVKGMYVSGNGVEIFSTIQSIDSATQITLDQPASASMTSSLDFLPANLSLTNLDGLSHIDRNIGRYYSDYIFPYIASSVSGQFGNGSPTKTNRFFPVPGNHDWADPLSEDESFALCDLSGRSTPDLTPYLTYFAGLNPTNVPTLTFGTTRNATGQTVPLTQPFYYSFTMGTTSTGQPLIEFFAFDSDPADPNLLNGNNPATLTPAQVIASPEGQWLQTAMANSKAVWKIPYFHHAPYTSSIVGNQGGNGSWMQLPFQQWGASTVLYGHVHNYERFQLSDPGTQGPSIPYIMNGAGGAPITPFTEVETGSQLRYNGNWGASKITADESKMTFQFFNVYGALIDEVSVTNEVPSATSGPGEFDPLTATWYLRNTTTAGDPSFTPFSYGAPGWRPVVGDWNGDHITTVGVVDPGSATWYLRNSNSGGNPDFPAFSYGAPGWIPVAGDWDGNGTVTAGTFDPGTATWYLRNSNSAGNPDIAPFSYGAPGWIPLTGDWNGDGTWSIGMFDPTSGTWYLRNSNSAGRPDFPPFAYGGIGWRPVVGDWNGDGKFTVGVIDPASATWYLRNENSAGMADITPFAYGMGFWTPLAGAWSGPPASSPLLASQIGSGGSGAALDSADLAHILNTALQSLTQAGIDTQSLARATVQVVDLPGRQLGLASRADNTISLDRDAAGLGWFVDPTPATAEEFADVGNSWRALAGGTAAGTVDLLTVMMHELGHLAGLEDVYDGGNGLMSGVLAPGIRRRV